MQGNVVTVGWAYSWWSRRFHHHLHSFFQQRLSSPVLIATSHARLFQYGQDTQSNGLFVLRSKFGKS